MKFAPALLPVFAHAILRELSIRVKTMQITLDSFLPTATHSKTAKDVESVKQPKACHYHA